MYKSITILYLTCFVLYLFCSRQPDYFDGEFAPATIIFLKDSNSAKAIPKAVFHDGKIEHAIDARYFLRDLQDGDKVKVIYESEQAEKARVYMFWGYWITWHELLATIFIYFALFKIALAVTQNPTPEALLEQLETKVEPKKKYIE